MSDDLLSKTCTPCRGGVPPLTRAEAERYSPQAPGWAFGDEGRCIERSFSFKNFKEAMDFVAQVGKLAESEGHHPDISFGWDCAKVSWQTKKIGSPTRTTSSWRPRRASCRGHEATHATA